MLDGSKLMEIDNVRERYFGSAWKVTGGGKWTVREREEKGKKGKGFFFSRL